MGRSEAKAQAGVFLLSQRERMGDKEKDGDGVQFMLASSLYLGLSAYQ